MDIQVHAALGTPKSLDLISASFTVAQMIKNLPVKQETWV